MFGKELEGVGDRAMQVLHNIKFYVTLLSWILSFTICFEVPVEWRERINRVCLEAEKGNFFIRSRMQGQ